MKKSDPAKKIVSAALFAALTFIATLIHIHFPGMMTGYVNIGDTMVIASAILLGPVYGAGAAAVGSALTALFHGYVIYVPGTFVIKFILAVGAYFVFRLLSGKHKEIKVEVYSEHHHKDRHDPFNIGTFISSDSGVFNCKSTRSGS